MKRLLSTTVVTAPPTSSPPPLHPPPRPPPPPHLRPALEEEAHDDDLLRDRRLDDRFSSFISSGGLSEQQRIGGDVCVGGMEGMGGRGEISLLCLNCYLVPPSVSWNPYFWAPFWSCKRPGERAKKIGQLAKRYDLVCLQEVWGTHMSCLNNAVSATHSILPGTESCASRSGWLSEMVDPVRLFYNQVGGLWFAWRRNKLEWRSMDKQHFDGPGQVPFSNQNVTVIEYGGVGDLHGTRLMVFNTHFSVFGGEARKSNVKAVEKFLRLALWKVYLHRLAYPPSRSKKDAVGMGEEVMEEPNVLTDISILLLGDFNVDLNRSPKAYKALHTLNSTAKMRDLFLPSNNRLYDHQDTYCTQEMDVREKQTGNSLFPWPFHGRVDYIFGVDELYISKDNLLDLITNHPPECVLADYVLLDSRGRGATAGASNVVGGVATSEEEKKRRRDEMKRLSSLEIPVLQDGDLILYFSRVMCHGMDILTQPYGEELSDHWGLSTRLSFSPPDPMSDSMDYTRGIPLPEGGPPIPRSPSPAARRRGSSARTRRTQQKKTASAEKRREKDLRETREEIEKEEDERKTVGGGGLT
eukprot:GHVQ01041204.1.p1 GENE.GHVQ01041204.1~~GHVQ01041204.1.p1  ORF type:complete len:581 (-),score=116.43 GHVQ01041204.1:616-2358(-)